jgi:hypothetical protein
VVKKDATESIAAGLPAEVDGMNAGVDRNWQLALSLIAAWRGADRERAGLAVAQRLASLAAEGDPAVAQQAVLGLTALSNMFLELYAERAGSSSETVLYDAAALSWDDGPTRP